MASSAFAPASPVPQVPLDEVKAAFLSVSEYVPYGSANQKHSLQDYAIIRVEFIRTLATLVNGMSNDNSLQSTYPIFFKAKASPYFNKERIRVILNSILASAAGVGNCGEQSRIGYSLLWPHPGSKEVINIESKIPKAPNHAVLALNRDPATAVEKPEEWNPETVLFDTWSNMLVLLSENKISKLTLAQMGNVPGTEDDITLDSSAFTSGARHSEEAGVVAQYLQGALQILENEGEDLFEFAAQKSSWKDINIEWELTKYITYLKDQVAYYSAASQPIRAAAPASPAPILKDIDDDRYAPPGEERESRYRRDRERRQRKKDDAPREKCRDHSPGRNPYSHFGKKDRFEKTARSKASSHRVDRSPTRR